MLINSPLSHAKETHWDDFTLEIERLNVAKQLSGSCPCTRSSILGFQANMVRVVSRRKNAPVIPESDEVQNGIEHDLSKVDETPLEVYGSPRVDPLMRPQLNGHPKVLAALDGRWWKLGLSEGRVQD